LNLNDCDFYLWFIEQNNKIRGIKMSMKKGKEPNKTCQSHHYMKARQIYKFLSCCSFDCINIIKFQRTLHKSFDKKLFKKSEKIFLSITPHLSNFGFSLPSDVFFFHKLNRNWRVFVNINHLSEEWAEPFVAPTPAFPCLVCL